MKKNYLKIVPLIAFTLVGCTGGATLKDTAGNKITFKRENVSCTKDLAYTNYGEFGPEVYYKCTANGVREDLAGKKYAKQYEEWCDSDTESKESESNIACVAGLKFGLY